MALPKNVRKAFIKKLTFLYDTTLTLLDIGSIYLNIIKSIYDEPETNKYLISQGKVETFSSNTRNKTRASIPTYVIQKNTESF